MVRTRLQEMYILCFVCLLPRHKYSVSNLSVQSQDIVDDEGLSHPSCFFARNILVQYNMLKLISVLYTPCGIFVDLGEAVDSVNHFI
jgi:hypothetical protein